MVRSPEDVVRDFCAAWSVLNVSELMAFFTPEAVYHNMPGPPATGMDAVRKTISGFLDTWQETTWEISNLASAGNIVFAERVDRTVSNGKHVDLPCVGVFEIEGGKIRAWRDYFDLQTYLRAMR